MQYVSLHWGHNRVGSRRSCPPAVTVKTLKTFQSGLPAFPLGEPRHPLVQVGAGEEGPVPMSPNEVLMFGADRAVSGGVPDGHDAAVTAQSAVPELADGLPAGRGPGHSPSIGRGVSTPGGGEPPPGSSIGSADAPGGSATSPRPPSSYSASKQPNHVNYIQPPPVTRKGLLAVGEIAAAGIGIRVMQQGFQSDLGIAPMRYLHEVRLARVREDLLRSDTGEAGVVEIAFRWGFAHLGRLLRDIENFAGWMPSETLRGT